MSYNILSMKHSSAQILQLQWCESLILQLKLTTIFLIGQMNWMVRIDRHGNLAFYTWKVQHSRLCNSKSIYLSYLQENENWYSGPASIYESSHPFLCETSSISDIPVDTSETESPFFLNQMDNDVYFLTRLSSHDKLIQIVAWLQTSAKKQFCLLENERPIKCRELNHAYITVIKGLQNSGFQLRLIILSRTNRCQLANI